jgi:sugar diacid utilization regulator
MERAQRVESDRQAAARDRGAEGSAPRSTPLTIVSGAVAGDDLESLAASAAAELDRPVVIVIPGLGAPIVAPAGSVSSDVLAELTALAADAIDGAGPVNGDDVRIRIGEQTVGIVAVAAVPAAPARADTRAWLEGVATAAAVISLLRETRQGAPPERSPAALLRALVSSDRVDSDEFLAEAGRHGFDFEDGAVAVAFRSPAGATLQPGAALQAEHPAVLFAELAPGRISGLVPLADAAEVSEAAQALVDEIRRRGFECGCSAPHRDAGRLHEAMREAEVMLELTAHAAGQEETYRLLVGVLSHDPDEVAQLRERTISPLVAYDDRHDTELLATLSAFLAHHGSTSETADAMGLHRHTVGYRLARVHEVSGLSPYESDGRERLSLGLKAHHILEASRQLAARP